MSTHIDVTAAQMAYDEAIDKAKAGGNMLTTADKLTAMRAAIAAHEATRGEFVIALNRQQATKLGEVLSLYTDEGPGSGWQSDELSKLAAHIECSIAKGPQA